jgi:multisubunit Na+/H+ antiporter MnhC subunit
MMYIVILLIFMAGFYCLLASFNLMRLLIALELMIKSVTLLIIYAGNQSQHLALTQSLVITLIVIEVVVMVVAAGVVLGLHRYHNSLNTKHIKNLKG